MIGIKNKYYTYKNSGEAYMMTQNYDGGNSQLSFVANSGSGGNIRWYTGVGASSKTASMILDSGYNLTVANGLYADNIHATKEVTAARLATGYDEGIAGSVMCNNWFRAYGQSGFYCSSYGGGWYMYDTSWMRCYGDKGIYSYNTFQGHNSGGNFG